MARQTVVIAPPPPRKSGPRRTVVVRAGPPKKRGSRVDAAVGVAGVILLVVSVMLVDVLPEEEIILPQFQVSFEDIPGPQEPTRRETFAEGETRNFEYLIEEKSITSITLTVAWEDDMPASEPDQFRISLIDPNGIEVVSQLHENSPGTQQIDPATGQITYLADPFEVRLAYSPNSRPQAAVVEGKTPSETAEEVLARVAPDFVAGGDGVWTVKATLVRAGDCEIDSGLGVPIPACADSNANPIGDPSNPGDHDQGNDFAVTLFTYTRYEPVVTPLA